MIYALVGRFLEHLLIGCFCPIDDHGLIELPDFPKDRFRPGTTRAGQSDHVVLNMECLKMP